MTRKDFVAIAKILSNNRVHNGTHQIYHADELVNDIAEYLTTTNENFDKLRFIEASQ